MQELQKSINQDTHYNDEPIEKPEQDRFGFDPFAKAVAASILKLAFPKGTVIALNGRWGSGKSSAVNLIRHYLSPAVERNEIAIVNFNCWWFKGEEALTRAFFGELAAALGPSIGKKLRKSLARLTPRLLSAGSVVGAGLAMTSAAPAAALTTGVMGLLEKLWKPNDTLEALYSELSRTLAQQKKRFLIVIDDIDRLSPDDALQMFRLVKSVGRLPNVMYLLVYDRKLAEKIVGERFPSEGPHYLEKIVQASFDVPEARSTELQQHLLQRIGSICGEPQEDDVVRTMNIFFDVVVPDIKTPRDLIRFSNALSVTWPAVDGEVDLGDFIGMEILRIFRPGISQAIRNQKERLFPIVDWRHGGQKPDGKEYDRLFLGSEPEAERERLRQSLKRLFPQLEGVWSNVLYSDDSEQKWSRLRRVCSKVHFDTYFCFSIGDETLSKTEIDQLVGRCSDSEFIKTVFREALTVIRSNGQTKAALLLDELNIHADQISTSKIEPLLQTLFELGDEINIGADEAKGFSIGDNQLRIHWLLRRLVWGRLSLEDRSAVFIRIAPTAALSWLADFTRSAYNDHHPHEGKQPEPDDSCLTTAADADVLQQLTLGRLRQAAHDGTLAANKRLPYLLFSWAAIAADKGAEVKQWANAQLENDEMIALFAQAFTSHSWSQGMGFSGLDDRVAKRNIRVNVNNLDVILDKKRFRQRVEELSERPELAAPMASQLREFLQAWKWHDANPND
jgi:predicted KAP-like P-loop ATPase